MTTYLASLLGLPSAEQVGFLLSVLLAFALGWTMRGNRDWRARERRRRAMWSGGKVR